MTRKDSLQNLVEGRDFYIENGLMVLTGFYLSERGYCCSNGCRHCPYEASEKEDLELTRPLM